MCRTRPGLPLRKTEKMTRKDTWPLAKPKSSGACWRSRRQSPVLVHGQKEEPGQVNKCYGRLSPVTSVRDLFQLLQLTESEPLTSLQRSSNRLENPNSLLQSNRRHHSDYDISYPELGLAPQNSPPLRLAAQDGIRLATCQIPLGFVLCIRGGRAGGESLGFVLHIRRRRAWHKLQLVSADRSGEAEAYATGRVSGSFCISCADGQVAGVSGSFRTFCTAGGEGPGFVLHNPHTGGGSVPGSFRCISQQPVRGESFRYVSQQPGRGESRVRFVHSAPAGRSRGSRVRFVYSAQAGERGEPRATPQLG